MVRMKSAGSKSRREILMPKREALQIVSYTHLSLVCLLPGYYRVRNQLEGSGLELPIRDRQIAENCSRNPQAHYAFSTFLKTWKRLVFQPYH